MTTSGESTAYTERAAETVVDSAVEISDIDGNADWNNGKLMVQITTNSSAYAPAIGTKRPKQTEDRRVAFIIDI